MTDISEYGDLLFNTTIDEWGRRRINSLLEDGVKVLAVVGVAPIIKKWFHSLEAIHSFKRPHRAIKLAHALWALHTWTVTVPVVIIRQWCASLKISHVFCRPERKMLYRQALSSAHTFAKPLRVIKILIFLDIIHTARRPHRLIKFLQWSRLIQEYYVSKPGVKKTRLYLVIGELAFQLSGD